MTLKGIFHIHSRFSYDGKIGLAKICDLAKAHRLDFMVVTEHDDYLDDLKLREIDRTCEALSSADFVVVPGIEVRCADDIHLLSIGTIARYPVGSPLLKVLERSRALGNLAIVAHPKGGFFKKYAKEASLIDGFEIWNNKENSRWAPSIQAIRQFRKIRGFAKSCVAFGGLDFHDTYQFASPWLVVDADSLSKEGILKSLRKGAFRMTNGILTLSSTIEIPSLELQRVYLLYLVKFFSGLFAKFIPVNIRGQIKKVVEGA